MANAAASLFVQIAGDASGFQGALSQVEKGIGGMGSKLESFGGGLTKAGGAITTLTAPITAVGAGLAAFAADGIKQAVSLEAQLSGISAVMGIAAEDTARLKDLILDLGIDPTLKVSSQEAADAIELLARNGLKMEQIMGGAAKSTVLLANSTGAGFDVAANIATDAMAIFGISAEDMMEAVNGITSVTTASKFDINDYALALAQAGGVASAVGVEFDDFNTAIAGISPLFASGSDAGTSLKTMLTRLVPASGNAAEEMAKLGLISFSTEGALRALESFGIKMDTKDPQILKDRLWELASSMGALGTDSTKAAEKFHDWLTVTGAMGNQFFDANGQLKDMTDIAGVLQGALSGLSEEQQNEALATIFGADAMRAAVGMAKLGEKGFADLQATMGKTDAADAAAKRMDNLAGAMEILEGIVDTIKIQVGESFIPILRTAAETLAGFFEQNGDKIVQLFKNMAPLVGELLNSILGLAQKGFALLDFFLKLPQPIQNTIVKFAALATVIGPFLVVAGAVVSSVGGLISSFGSLVGIVKAVPAALGAIKSVGAIGGLLGSVGSLGGLFSGIAAAAGPALAGIIGILTGPLALAIGAVVAAVGGLYLAWKNNWFGIRDTLQPVVDAVRISLSGLWNIITGQDNPFGDWSLWFEELERLVGTGFAEIVTSIGEWIYDIRKAFLGWFENLDVGAGISGAFDKAKGFLSKGFQSLFGRETETTAAPLSENFENGLEAVAQRFWDTSGSVDGFAQTLRSAAGESQGVMGRLRETLSSTYEVARLLVTGDFRGGIFGIHEDEPAIDALFKVRELIPSVYEATRLLVTGDFRGGIFGLHEDDPAINSLFKLRENALSVYEATRLLATGDFRGGIFGLHEDDPAISALFAVREGILAIPEALASGQGLGAVGDVLGATLGGLKDNIANVFTGTEIDFTPLAQALLDFGIPPTVTAEIRGKLERTFQNLQGVGGSLAKGLGNAVGKIIGPISDVNQHLPVLADYFSFTAETGDWLNDSLVDLPVRMRGIVQAAGKVVGAGKNLPEAFGALSGDVSRALAGEGINFDFFAQKMQGLGVDPKIAQGLKNSLVNLFTGQDFGSLGEVLIHVIGQGIVKAQSLLGDVGQRIADVFAGGFASARSTVVGIIQPVIDGIASAFQGARSFLAGIWQNTLGGIFSGIGNVTGSVFDGISGIISTVGSTIASAFQPVLDVLSPLFQAIGGLFSSIAGLFGAVGNVIGAFFGVIGKAALGFYQNVITPVFEGVASVVVGAASAVAGAIGNVIGGALSAVSGFVTSTIIPVFTSIGEAILGTVSTIAGAIGGLITGVFGAMFAFVTGTLLPSFQTFGDTVAGAVLPVFESIGTFFTGTLLPIVGSVATAIGTGLLTAFTAVTTFLSTVWSATIGGIATFFTGVLLPGLGNVSTFLTNTFVGAWQGLTNIITSTVLPVFQSIADFINGALTAAFNTFKGLVDGVTWALDGIAGAVQGATGWLNGLADRLTTMSLPGWLTPGSPTPFELGLRGIADAAQLAQGALSGGIVDSSLPAPSLPGGGAGGGGATLNAPLIGSVTVAGEADEDRLVAKIRDMMMRDFGIATGQNARQPLGIG